MSSSAPKEARRKRVAGKMCPYQKGRSASQDAKDHEYLFIFSLFLLSFHPFLSCVSHKSELSWIKKSMSVHR